MKNSFQNQVVGIPVHSATYRVGRSAVGYLPEPENRCHFSHPEKRYPSMNQVNKADSVLARMSKLGKKADNFANGVWEHVRLGPKITETVKGKLSLGAKILQSGGMEKIFKRLFNTCEDEALLKASQCYLSTTAGPIAGLLFISTKKIAFCSERSIKFSSPDGKPIRIHYRVLIPNWKVKRVSQSVNEKNPSQKYLEIVTVDNFDFWFMGFLNYQKTFQYLQQATSKSSDDLQFTC